MRLGLILLATLAFIAIVGVMQYKACRLKFPDAPAWACAVRP